MQVKSVQYNLLSASQLCGCAACEPTVTAMGHTFRKLRMFKEAAACFDSALSILPGQASTFAGLAYTYHLEVSPPALPVHPPAQKRLP